MHPGRILHEHCLGPFEMAQSRWLQRITKTRPMRSLEDAPPGTPRFPAEWRFFAADLVESWEAFDRGEDRDK